MKDRFILLGIICLAASCKSVQPVSTGSAANGSSSKSTTIEFIDNIAINPGSGSSGSKPVQYIPTERNYSKTKGNGTIEKYSDLRFKYAILENAPVEELTNSRLLDFMEEWYGTQYHYGGNSKDGIDCSAFVTLLMNTVFDISSMPRTSKEQYNQCKRIKKDELQEGDLVFFHTQGKHHIVSHVGVYLRNNKFVHASVSGVMISDMQEGYYAQHYVGGGRY